MTAPPRSDRGREKHAARQRAYWAHRRAKQLRAEPSTSPIVPAPRRPRRLDLVCVVNRPITASRTTRRHSEHQCWSHVLALLPPLISATASPERGSRTVVTQPYSKETQASPSRLYTTFLDSLPHHSRRIEATSRELGAAPEMTRTVVFKLKFVVCTAPNRRFDCVLWPRAY